MKPITCICALAAILCAPVANGTETPRERPPNIILIMADDLGYEAIGANGSESYETPHLDRLAASGARFEHCYAQPLCTPSRVQIMTGIYNVRNYTAFGRLPRNATTFAHLLKEAGYATGVAGKWQLGAEPDSPRHFGFDEALLWQHTRGRTREGTNHDSRYENPRLERNGVPVDYNDGEYGPDLFVDFIGAFMEAHRDEPFFVYYPMVLTHCPFVPTPGSDAWDAKSPGSPTYKGDPQFFADMVSYMDNLIGRIAAQVEALGLEENTVILFTGDNGTDYPVESVMNGRTVAGAKGKTTDAGTRVPLIVSGPGLVEPGVVSDLIDFSDFLPTLCDLAGIAVPESIDGRSFLPQLRGEPGDPRAYVYCWYSRQGNDADARVFARTKQYKLYRSGAFYDVAADPAEARPLPSDGLGNEEQQVKRMLRGVIERYQADRPR